MKYAKIFCIFVFCILIIDFFGFEFNPSESELFRAVSKSVFKPERKIFCISFDENRQKPILLNPIHSASIQNINPNQYESV